MEKVLEHFKNSDDPLKYESAKFLIENMPFHSSIYGEDMEKYNQAYNEIGSVPKEYRDSVWKSLTDSLNKKDFKLYPDIM